MVFAWSAKGNNRTKKYYYLGRIMHMKRKLLKMLVDKRIRNKITGTAEMPRLAVFRSNNHMYAQIIDDTVGNTLTSASTLEKEVQKDIKKTNNVEAAEQLGKVVAKRALDQDIKTVVFDRGGFIYAGKIKAFADSAREAGLEF